MRKSLHILAWSLALSSVLAPSVMFAAYNDLNLTTSAIITVGGYPLNVSGTTNAVQSITVNASNFSVTLLSGSSITVSSATRNQLSTDIQSDVSSNTCNGSTSSLALSYSGAGSVTNTVTPSAPICSSAAAVTTTTSGNNGPIVSSGGGGGGGGGTYVAPTIATPIATSIVASPSITTTVATQSTLPTAPALVPVVYGTPKPLFPKPSFVFTGKTLVKGLKNSLDIKNLQTFLAKDPTIYPEGIVNGNFGALTEKAIQRFQIKYGIIVNKKQMTRAYGYGIIGPRTRIKMMQVFNSN